MDCNTGRLMALARALGREQALPAGFDPVPDELAVAARMKLAGRAEAKVNLRSGSPLAKWAKKKRKEKQATASRRRNRK